MQEITSNDIIEIGIVTATLVVLWIINKSLSRADRQAELAGESFKRNWKAVFGRLGGPPMVARGPGPLVIMAGCGYAAFLSWKLFVSRVPFYVLLVIGALQLLPAVVVIFQSAIPAARTIRRASTRMFDRNSSEENENQ